MIAIVMSDIETIHIKPVEKVILICVVLVFSFCDSSAQKFDLDDLSRLVLLNERSDSLGFESIQIKEETIRSVGKDSLYIEFDAILKTMWQNDTTRNFFSGIIYDNDFYFHGPYIYSSSHLGSAALKFGKFFSNRLSGFQITTTKLDMNIRSIDYFSNGSKNLSISIDKGELTYSEVNGILDGSFIYNFSEGKIKYLSLLSEQDVLLSSVELDTDGRISSYGNFLDDIVYFTFKENNGYFKFNSELYRSPFEVLDFEQAMYVQSEISKTNEIPLRKGVWFVLGENGKIRIIDYD